MEENIDCIRILADAMTYLDRAYCRGSIIQWTHTSPEGAAYAIVRQLLTVLVEEPSGRDRDAKLAA